MRWVLGRRTKLTRLVLWKPHVNLLSQAFDAQARIFITSNKLCNDRSTLFPQKSTDIDVYHAKHAKDLQYYSLFTVHEFCFWPQLHGTGLLSKRHQVLLFQGVYRPKIILIQ